MFENLKTQLDREIIYNIFNFRMKMNEDSNSGSFSNSKNFKEKN